MQLFDTTGKGYYLVQTKNQTCFLVYMERDQSGQAQLTSAIALNSPVGVQKLTVEEIYEAVCLKDLGIAEVPVDFREMLKLLWNSQEKSFWEYNWLLVDYFNDLMRQDTQLLAA